jgi:hypothetical protein
MKEKVIKSDGYLFRPEKDITVYELALVIGSVLENSTFLFIPRGTERHFFWPPDCKVTTPSIIDDIKEFIGL